MRVSRHKYKNLLQNIGSAIETGRHIVEFEQHGSERAEYGIALINNLSKDLKVRHGKGFSRSNIQLMRLFYIKYPKFQTSGKSWKSQTSGKLTWSHYSELLGISDDMARAFYEHQAIKENWSVRELKRQSDSALFQRLALSKDKKAVLALATKGQHITSTGDLIKDPYVFEFLKISESKRNHGGQLANP